MPWRSASAARRRSHFFRLGKLAAGETVLINGASGAVGTMAVQLAKHLGAEVTAVCSGANAELVSEPRGRPRHRLHGGGLHAQRAALRRDHGQSRQRALRAGQGLAETGRPLPDGHRRSLADARRVAAEGHDQRRRQRLLDHRRRLPNPHVAGRAGSAEAGDRLGPAVRADRRGASPGRQRPQGRERRAHVRAGRVRVAQPTRPGGGHAQNGVPGAPVGLQHPRMHAAPPGAPARARKPALRGEHVHEPTDGGVGRSDRRPRRPSRRAGAGAARWPPWSSRRTRRRRIPEEAAPHRSGSSGARRRPRRASPVSACGTRLARRMGSVGATAEMPHARGVVVGLAGIAVRADADGEVHVPGVLVRAGVGLPRPAAGPLGDAPVRDDVGECRVRSQPDLLGDVVNRATAGAVVGDVERADHPSGVRVVPARPAGMGVVADRPVARLRAIGCQRVDLVAQLDERVGQAPGHPTTSGVGTRPPRLPAWPRLRHAPPATPAGAGTPPWRP